MSLKPTNSSKFYLHEKLGCIPVGWDVVRLGKDFDFFPTATYSRSQLSDTEQCLYIHYGDLHTQFERFIDIEKDYLPSISFEMAKKYTPIAEGDLIISDASEDYEGVGKAVEIINVKDKTIIAGLHTLHLRVKNDEFIKGFKGYILNQEKVRNNILRIATGIKVYSISKSQLKKIYLPKPPKNEQIEITKILTLIDEAIIVTKNSIAKAERLKKSLMQKLLTGKLKPDGTWRKKDDFYEVEKFGRVPKGWEVKRIDKLCNRRTEPFEPRKTRIALRYIGLEHIVPDKFCLNGFGSSVDTVSTKVKFYSGDILYGKLRPYLNKVVKLDFDGVTTTECIVLNSKENIDWVYLNLQQNRFLNHAKSMTAGTQHPRARWRDIAKYLISIPEDYDEQEVITKRIIDFEKNSISKKSKIDTLEKLKKALMQNLLTGKVRVKLK